MNIYVLSTLEMGIDVTDILKKSLKIQGLIGLSERQQTNAISGYRYLKGYCDDNNFSFIEMDNYSLSNPKDKEKLLSLDIDILIVAGWQRLIPKWLIEHCKICAIGSHGSAYGITGGRGRSPQNWALLTGRKEFYISIFKIDEGADSGQIIDTRKFVLSDLDDIKTSYYRTNWLIANMIVENVNKQKISGLSFQEQQGEPQYLPQRFPEDGEIDWSRMSHRIYNSVRALTKPYPGAFSYVGGGGRNSSSGKLDRLKLRHLRCHPISMEKSSKFFRVAMFSLRPETASCLLKTIY